MKTYNAIYKYGHLFDKESGKRILLKENAELAIVIESEEKNLYKIDPKNNPKDDGNVPRTSEGLLEIIKAENYYHSEKILSVNQHIYFIIKAGEKDEQGKRPFTCCFRITLLEDLFMVWKDKDTKLGEFFYKDRRSCSCVVDKIEFGELEGLYFEPIYGSSLSDVYTLTFEMYFSRFGRSGVNIYKYLQFVPNGSTEQFEELRQISRYKHQ
jgi:hypothetical protein